MNGRLWTAEEVTRLRELYPDAVGSVLLAALPGRTMKQVYAKANLMGLRRSEAYLASPAACRLRRGDNIGAASHFPKGHEPHNKGLRRPGWGPGRMKATQFRKGNKPQTWVPVGTERVNDGYLQRKMTDTGYSPSDFRSVHVMLWEAHNGLIPSNHAVIFRDGNRQNIVIENLELVSRAELMRRNSYHTRYPKEVGLAIQLRGQLMRQINKRKRREEQAG